MCSFSISWNLDTLRTTPTKFGAGPVFGNPSTVLCYFWEYYWVVACLGSLIPSLNWESFVWPLLLIILLKVFIILALVIISCFKFFFTRSSLSNKTILLFFSLFLSVLTQSVVGKLGGSQLSGCGMAVPNARCFLCTGHKGHADPNQSLDFWDYTYEICIYI